MWLVIWVEILEDEEISNWYDYEVFATKGEALKFYDDLKDKTKLIKMLVKSGLDKNQEKEFILRRRG